MPKAREPQAFSRLAEQLVADLRGVPSELPTRSRPRPTQPLAGLIETLRQEYRLGRDAPEYTLRERWREIVGAAAAGYSHPVTLERNLLLVLVSHAVVRNELFHHRETILGRIRAVPGCEGVKGINLRMG
jgi:hypothetical protein